MYINESLTKYVDDLAAKLPAPGGGSAAALCGALGAALLEMVCNFTAGKEKYKDIETAIQKHLASLRDYRMEFLALVDEDVKAYSGISAAFKTKDKLAIDKALKDGYYISLKMSKLSVDVIKIALDLSGKGNKNLITDVGCGAELLEACLNSSLFNAEINLKGVEDKGFVEKERKILDTLKKEMAVLYKETVSKIEIREEK